MRQSGAADCTSKGLIIAVLGFALAGCGGSSGTSSNPGQTPQPDDDDDSSPTQPAPSLSFSASPDAVAAGGNSTLSWRAENASGCEASGGWSGSRGVSGSESVGPIDQDTVFRLSCSGAGGGVSRQLTVRVAQDDELAVQLSASSLQIGENDSVTLTWTSQEATECDASGGWSGDRPVSGTFETGPLGVTTTFSLSCGNGSENALASVTVEVLDKTLRWQAPTENVDGSPLTDLAGFVVYWGQQSRSYSGEYRIDDATVTQWEADIAPGDYFFALTAVDAEGNESGYSNEVRKTIP